MRKPIPICIGGNFNATQRIFNEEMEKYNAKQHKWSCDICKKFRKRKDLTMGLHGMLGQGYYAWSCNECWPQMPIRRGLKKENPG